jgi:hypothetical protein
LVPDAFRFLVVEVFQEHLCPGAFFVVGLAFEALVQGLGLFVLALEKQREGEVGIDPFCLGVHIHGFWGGLCYGGDFLGEQAISEQVAISIGGVGADGIVVWLLFAEEF